MPRLCKCGHDKVDHKNDGINQNNRNTECEGPYCNCKEFEVDKIL